MMDKKTVRLNKICQILRERSVVSARQLSEDLQVSEMTIRRDISALEKNNVIKVFFGGISLNIEKDNKKAASNGYLFDNEIKYYSDEKRRIAQKAASLIEPNDVIFVDTGSTTSQIIQYIPDEMNNIVYSYSLSVLNAAAEKDNLQIVGCSGYYHKNTRMFESTEGLDYIKKATINKVFMAARGVSTDGVTTAEPYEIHMKRAVLESAEQKILMVDSSKIGKSWYSKYADLEEFDIIITDSKLSAQNAKMLEDHHIKVYIV